MTWHALIAKPEFDRAVQAERRRQVEKGYDAAHDDEHGIEHLCRWRESYFRRGLVIAAAALDIAIEEHLARLASRCTCPTGDGSLRWPCPAHPPTGSNDPYADCACGHGRHTHVRYYGACGLCGCRAVLEPSEREPQS